MRSVKSATVVASLVVGACFSAGSSGCLSRDVASDAPTVKTNFGVNVQQTAVDKVDLLFMIDNSTSMGDKQFLLEQAVPVLVSRLVTPNCIGADGNPIKNASGTIEVAKSTDGTCTTGSPEFPAVHDMHIGVVSSSIGDFGVSSSGSGVASNAYVCPATTYPAQNDHARLLNRDPSKNDGTGTASTDALPNNYLAWFPSFGNTGKTAPSPKVTSGTVLASDFTSMVAGVEQFGCGLEAQLESWYQFLIQPDPFASITVTNGVASRVGVDTTILKQRKDFLRPDSLVAVIGLSDEDDSTVDPGAFGGQSWIFERQAAAPLPTAECASNPNDPKCTSCALFSSSTAPSECQANNGTYAAANDNLNVRFVRMKQRYGIDPQYPVSRYVDGLKNTTVPNRSGETHKADLYAPTANCTNPLYAAELPDPSSLSSSIETAGTISDADAKTLCNLSVGSRSSQLVFFGFIGGVPWQLLTDSPATATETNSVAFKAALDDADWKLIIGNSPETYDYSGQDIHMAQSATPRSMNPTTPFGVPVTAEQTANVLKTDIPVFPGSPASDPFNGADYDSQQTDLMYACTFQLPPHTDGTVGTDCSDTAIAADKAAGSASPYDGLLSEICDCESPMNGLVGGQRPLCSSTTPTLQTRGKAYPTIREFSVVHDMGTNGIIASLCPRTLNTSDTDNYGYNPAVSAIISRLKTQLASVCPPRTLAVDANGLVPCQVVEVLATGTCSDNNLQPATGSVLTSFQEQQAASGPNGGDGGAAVTGVNPGNICVVPNIAPSGDGCATNQGAGFCYVTGAEAPSDTAAVKCGGVIKFSAGGLPTGAVANLECLETSSSSSGTTTTTTATSDSGATNATTGD